MRVLFFIALSIIASYASAKGDYTTNSEMNALIDELVTHHEFDREPLTALLHTAKRKQSILDAISRPAEKRLDWAQYSNIFLKTKRTRQGIQFWEEHQETLQRASEQYGVPEQIIVAIIGVETRYGRNKGSYRVIDALSTLAFDYPKRATFFRKQLLEFMLLSREAHIDPETAVGSYAGAMGFGQFIPSSYRAYAVDFDNDGITDIINNPVDAIGSVANYFAEHRWQTGQPVAGRASIQSQDYDSIINGSLKPSLTVGEIAQKGLQVIPCTENDAPLLRYCMDISAEEPATAMKLMGHQGAEFWIGAKNFYVITRYNHSKLYAMAVYQLSRDIQDQYLENKNEQE